MASAPTRGMGIGDLGSSSLVFKRKFRWTLSIRRDCSTGTQDIPESFVKVAARPSLTVEETEINFLNGRTYIPGRGTWETMTITYIDVAGKTTSGNPNEGLWNWLASVYNFASTNPLTDIKQGTQSKDYTATGTLILWDGCGTAIEKWTLLNMWPTAVNFGDLDMSSNDTVDIELTCRYSAVQYQNYCPGINITGCCTTCGT